MNDQTAPQAIDLMASFRTETADLADWIRAAAEHALGTNDARTPLPQGADAALAELDEPLPDQGIGMQDALARLAHYNDAAGANTSGPRCFHFVIGGSTPAALGADVLATLHEAVPYTWVVSPIGVRMELQAIQWLLELFELPASWAGIMVTGASMANFVCLAAARQWWGHQHGVDVALQGVAGMPRMPVLTSGFVHASSRKMLGLLGIGYDQIQVHARDDFGRADLDALRRSLEHLDGQPALMIVNAGEVNAGEFDPVADMIDLARQHNCWVHVDGAFGLFARLSSRTRHLVAGVERADSVTVDGHKWLNVPYESGYALIRDHQLMAEAFRYAADYLPAADDPRPTLGAIGPESSRRARAFAVWATLKAYGREGHRQIVEHCLDMAAYCGELVQQSPHLELLAPVNLNITPFRYRVPNQTEDELDAFNKALGEAVLSDGRFLVGTSKLGPRTIFRPAFSNWRTRREDVEAFVRVIEELGANAAAG